MNGRRRILVYRVGSIGDTVVAMPALRVVSEAFPEAERWGLTNFVNNSKAASMAAVLEGTALLHGYIEYPLQTRDPRVLMRLRAQIRSFRPDVLIYLAAPRGQAKAVRDAAFFKTCGIHRLVGVPLTMDRQLPLRLADGTYEHEAVRLVRSLGSLARSRTVCADDFDLSLSPLEHARARSSLRMLGSARPILAVSIGAKVDVKDWGDANWSSLLARLSSELSGWLLVMIGATDERERSGVLASSWLGPSRNLCGELSVRESAAVLESASLFIGHDSGPMHMAAAVGTPCIAIFSSRNRRGHWFPFGNQHRVLYTSLPCQACGLSVCVELQKRCIMSISVNAVHDAVVDLLRQLHL